jgi:RNA polymerase sigma-70 factor, ECF subfamily
VTASDAVCPDERGSVLVTQGRVQPEPAGSVPGLHRVPPADALDETTLVVRAQEGDPNAFEAIARRHQAALYRVAVRVMGDPVEAEDALQEALIDAWRRIDRFRTDSSFATWMYRIVTNRCLSLLRRRRPVPVGDIDDRRPAPDDPGRSAELDAGLTALGRAVRALPDELRVCWVLRELEGLSYLDIAQITQASEDAVRGRIHRARVRLAEGMASWR